MEHPEIKEDASDRKLLTQVQLQPGPFALASKKRLWIFVDSISPFPSTVLSVENRGGSNFDSCPGGEGDS